MSVISAAYYVPVIIEGGVGLGLGGWCNEDMVFDIIIVVEVSHGRTCSVFSVERQQELKH